MGFSSEAYILMCQEQDAALDLTLYDDNNRLYLREHENPKGWDDEGGIRNPGDHSGGSG
ncbi:unnamed protein product [marine sediment metagenome]|uniref:Uncharacterized protein n=1 Tax=marine sediment metagenome TaxID=412755 RepID=X1BDF9_9ZZZZ